MNALDSRRAGLFAVACLALAWAARAQVAIPMVTPQPPDSTARQDTSARSGDTVSTGVRIYEYIAYPTLQIITWPVETILVPVVQVLIYPTREPVRYVLTENVVDRMIGLISFGEREQIKIYPTLNLASGTSSRTGLTFRNTSVFGRSSERLVAYVIYYVNGDFKLRSYVNVDDVAGTPFSLKVGASMIRMKNASVNQPGTNYFYQYSDTSEYYQGQISVPVLFGFQARVATTIRDNRFGQAPTNEHGLTGDFFRDDSVTGANRGLNQAFWDRTWAVGLARDTRNNENVTLAGSWMDLGWDIHDADKGHAYHSWGGQYTKYFKLGSERYEITGEEERRMGGMGMRQLFQKMEYEKLRQQIFSRKVVVLHLFVGQSFELPGNRMPIYGLQTLGNDSPLRGYSGSRFKDYTVAGFSTEYRFPVMRLMDGVIFDEYGVHGRSWDKIDYLDFKNSWGFGVRIRRPDIYLFRADLGFHGLSGMVFNLSVDAPF